MRDSFSPSSFFLDTNLGCSHEILRSSQAVDEGIGVVKGEEFEILEIPMMVQVVPQFTLFGLPVDVGIEIMVLYFDSCLICCRQIDQIDKRTWSKNFLYNFLYSCSNLHRLEPVDKIVVVLPSFHRCVQEHIGTVCT